jgi:Tfp pilus tip-associated adhesin PilY1
MNAVKRAIAIAFAMLISQSVSAALLSIAQYPLFLTHRTLPNVLVIYDNSESMDGTMAGKLIAGDDPTTRGNIARSVIRNTISSFSGQFNWGLESFATYGYGLYTTYPYWLGNDTTMVFTDDCVSGVSASNGGLRCIENPQWAGSVGDRYVTYDRASDDPDINDVLYIGDFGPGAWATSAGGGAYNFYFTHNPGPGFESNMANYWTTLGFTPTDAGYIPYNPPISRQLYARRAWGFYAGVNGQGQINEPILPPSSSGHLANIQALLATETPYGPELKNSAVFTPLAGSMLTANQYFSGGSTPISLSCQKSFVMLATDGNPTSDWWGNMYPLDQQQNTYNSTTSTWTFSPAANDVFGQISALRTVSVGGFTHDVQTYVVGMGDTVANPNSVAAMNRFASLGGTNSAYLAQDSASLAAAFQAIAVDIESKTAAASAVSLNTGSWGTGTNLYQARFNSGDWSGQLISYAINADGSIGAQQWDSGQVINGQNWDTGRAILTYKPSAALGARGIPFRWPTSFPGTPTATEMDVAQATLLNAPGAIAAGSLMNVALASNGGVASASSYYNSGYGPSGAINGDRSGANWGSGGGWNNASYNSFPEWLQVNFNGSKSITQVIVYSVQDIYYAPSEPTDTMTFNNYGLVNFSVQGWDGSGWVTLATVTGNNLVKRTLNFGAFTTDRIRIYVTAAADGYSRLTEVEAFGTAVSSGPDGYGPQRVQWLRGNAANETGTCGSCTPSFRSRPTSKLGDIIHSAPSYVAAPGSAYPDSMESASYSSFAAANANRTPMIYVGANDGMLHAFNANTGREAMAFVPTSVYKTLSNLTAQSLSAVAGEPVAHHYQVDGSPTISDVYYSGSWHTLLAGGLGAGGQGIYVLDVTTPSTFTQANAANIVRWEFSDANDVDMGYTFSQPLLVKTNNGRWSVIVGNGYNNSEDDGTFSSSGHAVLFVLDAETGALRAKIDTGSGVPGTPNGLSGPIAIDTNADGIADVVYAGDLNGNLWKFDLSSSTPGVWNVALGGAPLFSTPGQPITVRPDVTKFAQGGYLITFGTGRYIDTGDVGTTDVQSFYGIRDTGTAVGGISSLVRQSIVSSSATGSDGNTYRLSTHAVGPATIDSPLTGDNAIPQPDYAASKKGWYINLPAPGERIVSDANIRAGRVVFNTLIPNTDPCGFGGTGWVMEVDVMTGNRNDTPTFDTNDDKQISGADLNLNGTNDNASGRAISSIPAAAGFLRAPTQSGRPPFENKYVNTSSGSVTVIGETAGLGSQGRGSWRQLQ